MNFYNEHDQKAAAWLRQLIHEKLIPDGVVDERSIEDIVPAELAQYTQCHFFAGIGGWSLALQLAGWPADRPVWTGSCPCQPFSTAGQGAGFADERHLWPAFFHLISQCRPAKVFGEQVASPVALRWCDLVRADLEAAGYPFGVADLCAASVGSRLERHSRNGDDGNEPGWIGAGSDGSVAEEGPSTHWSAPMRECSDGFRRPVPAEPSLYPVAPRIPAHVVLLRGAGNAIVPQVAAEFIKATQ